MQEVENRIEFSFCHAPWKNSNKQAETFAMRSPEA